MKITLVVLIGLVAVVTATSGATVESIVKELRKDITKYGLECDDSLMQDYCARNHGHGAFLHTLCPKILESYLCDYNISDDDLEYFLKDLIQFG